MSYTTLDKALRGLMQYAEIVTNNSGIDQFLRLEIPRPYHDEMQAVIIVIVYPRKIYVAHNRWFGSEIGKEFDSGLPAEAYIDSILENDKKNSSESRGLST